MDEDQIKGSISYKVFLIFISRDGYRIHKKKYVCFPHQKDFWKTSHRGIYILNCLSIKADFSTLLNKL